MYFRRTIITSFIIIILLSIHGKSSYSADLRGLSFLKDISVKNSNDMITINLQFKGPLNYAVNYGKDYIQIVFNKTYIDPPKNIINVPGATIKKIFAYQFDKNTVRVRLYTYTDPKILQDKIHFIKNLHNLVITYKIESNHEVIINKVPSSLSRQTQFKNKKNEEVLTSGDIKKDYRKILTSKPLSNNFVTNHKKYNKLSFQNDSSYLFRSFVKMIGVLGLLLSILISGFYIFKKITNSKHINNNNDTNIKILNRAYIGPKKSIAIIAIGDERIVVGITASTISTLARLNKDGKFNAILQNEISEKEQIELYDELWEKA